MAPKLKKSHVVIKKEPAPPPSDKKGAPVSLVASAGTQCNVGASPDYGIMQLSPQTPASPVSSFPAPSGSSPMSDYFAGLPQEVLSDILIRLPLKSIGRSRCISKPWLSLLTSYEFTKAHLARHTHLAQEQKLLLYSKCSRLFSLTEHLGGYHLREVEFFDKKVIHVVGSCDGLVLVVTGGGVIWLINCLTQEYVMLPDSPFPLCRHWSFKKYGFGYDEISKDYKIVKISQCDYGQFGNDQPNCPEIFVDIYSLKTRSWKRLGTPFYGHDLLLHDCCVFVNGAFHWKGLKFTYSRKQSIVIGAFNLSDEKVTEIPAPAPINEGSHYLCGKLMIIDGCLGIVPDQSTDQHSEIWLMKSYSLVESWTKLVVDFSPICIHKDKILFRGGWPRAYKVYCLKDGRVDVCLAEDDGRGLDEGISYSESLISPHFNSQI